MSTPTFSVLHEQASAEARLGTVLSGRWQLREILGAGGMSVVYGAEHRNGRQLAIKMLRAAYAADPAVAERFLSEGYVANKVGHPAIVAVLDDDRTEDGLPFLVMERLEGESLEQRVARGPLSPAEALVVADRVLDALCAAHEKGILHRDIKPANLFLTKAREVRLLDFGIARCREVSGPVGTQAGSVMGTPTYMPPEQARGEWNLVDERSDLFALGATLFTLLTGDSARKAGTPNLSLLAAMSEPFPSLAAARPSVPAAVIRIVDTGTAFVRDKRWASAAAMREAVQAAWVEITGAPALSLKTALNPLAPTLPSSKETVPATPVGASPPMPPLFPQQEPAPALPNATAVLTTSRPVATPRDAGVESEAPPFRRPLLRPLALWLGAGLALGAVVVVATFGAGRSKPETADHAQAAAAPAPPPAPADPSPPTAQAAAASDPTPPNTSAPVASGRASDPHRTPRVLTLPPPRKPPSAPDAAGSAAQPPAASDPLKRRY